MELRHLRYFVVAAEAQNVSHAAIKLHISQPAVSRQIHDLEQELGFALFERSAKSVRLTEAGTAFLTEARAVLKRADDAVNAARAIANRARSELHIGYAPSPMARIMPASLRVFQAPVPQVRVKLYDLSTEEMLSGVREHKLELAFLVRPGRATLRGLHFEELLRERMLLAVPPNHRLAGVNPVPLSQVAQEQLVAFGRSEYPEYHEYLEHLFATIKTKPRIVEEPDSSASLIAAVESGAGVAIAPQSFSCSAGPRLKLIPITPEPERISIGIIWSANKRTANAKRFCDSARQAVAGLEVW